MLEPIQNESVRDWVRRARQHFGLEFGVSTIENHPWPLVRIEKFTALTGVGEWLNEHVGEGHYVWIAQCFWFTREADAVMFKLSWADKANG